MASENNGDGSSAYALSFDEIQHALGMNMDEFLRNIWTSEESQAITTAMCPLDGSNVCPVSLQKQGSLCPASTLSMKIEEETWGAGWGQQPEEFTSAAAAGGQQQLCQCLSLGEGADLEDFLVKAGIPRSCNENRPMGLNTLPLLLPPPSMDGPISPVHTPAQHGDSIWMINQHNKAFSQQHQQATEQILQGSAMVEAALSPGHDETSAELLTAQVGKRHTEVPIEKVFQKRQRRMMKNRESAARSRARKQAYTMELELEIDQLKEEIMTLLRKQEDASELSNKQAGCH